MGFFVCNYELNINMYIKKQSKGLRLYKINIFEMTINLTSGITSSVWLSLRESQPIGYTGSYQFTFTNDITGHIKISTPQDLQPTNKWSRFDFRVAKPENLNAGVLDMAPGMWSYVVEAQSTTLQTGKVFVTDPKTWAVLERPAKNTGALRR